MKEINREWNTWEMHNSIIYTNSTRRSLLQKQISDISRLAKNVQSQRLLPKTESNRSVFASHSSSTGTQDSTQLLKRLMEWCYNTFNQGCQFQDKKRIEILPIHCWRIGRQVNISIAGCFYGTSSKLVAFRTLNHIWALIIIVKKWASMILYEP